MLGGVHWETPEGPAIEQNLPGSVPRATGVPEATSSETSRPTHPADYNTILLPILLRINPFYKFVRNNDDDDNILHYYVLSTATGSAMWTQYTPTTGQDMT